MSFANLGNIFVPEVQVRGASNSLKIPILISFSKMLSWLFKLEVFLKLSNFRIRGLRCFHVNFFYCINTKSSPNQYLLLEKT